MYTVKNYKTKKELITDFKNGIEIEVYQPGPFPRKTDYRAAHGITQESEEL